MLHFYCLSYEFNSAQVLVKIVTSDQTSPSMLNDLQAPKKIQKVGENWISLQFLELQCCFNCFNGKIFTFYQEQQFKEVKIFSTSGTS